MSSAGGSVRHTHVKYFGQCPNKFQLNGFIHRSAFPRVQCVGPHFNLHWLVQPRVYFPAGVCFVFWVIDFSLRDFFKSIQIVWTCCLLPCSSGGPALISWSSPGGSGSCFMLVHAPGGPVLSLDSSLSLCGLLTRPVGQSHLGMCVWHGAWIFVLFVARPVVLLYTVGFTWCGVGSGAWFLF
jgi:hypothetical protein